MGLFIIVLTYMFHALYTYLLFILASYNHVFKFSNDLTVRQLNVLVTYSASLLDGVYKGFG